MKDLVTKRIQELIKQAPALWVDEVAERMNKSVVTIYAYARGERGTKNGQHKEVLRILKEIVAREQKEIQKLIS